MLWRWLCGKGYEVLVEQQIAHELQLSNVKTGTLAEIGQQADLAVIGGRRRQYARRGADHLARYDINVIGINRGNLGFLTDLDPDNALQQLADVLEGHRRETLSAGGPGVSAGLPETYQHRHQRSGAAPRQSGAYD
ncbi:NAD(+)/NADH kinase [Klebsiella pneumoniae]|nr:NAD(+)/NADH kinase [Klebsiella pneumoniae]